MYVSWLQAWANKKNEHFRWFFFETLSHRSVPNILRDFQKTLNLDDQLVHINYLSPIMSVSGPQNYADPFLRFLGPETDTFCHFLAPELVKMGQHTFWPRNWRYGSVSGPRNWHILSVSGPGNWPIMSVSGSRKFENKPISVQMDFSCFYWTYT